MLNPGRVAVWLYRLAVRHVLIYRRKTGRQRSLVDRYAARKAASEVDAAPSPLAWLVNDERQQLVQAALRRLAPRDAELLILKYAEGYGMRELAGRLGANVATIERVCIAHAIDSAQNWPIWPRNMRHPKMTKPDANDPLDDRLIDQIVDGDLTPAELRAAIERLDRQPDGWKRCAMAFLEAQCISESFRSLEPAASSSPALGDFLGYGRSHGGGPSLDTEPDCRRDHGGLIRPGLAGPRGPAVVGGPANQHGPGHGESGAARRWLAPGA